MIFSRPGKAHLRADAGPAATTAAAPATSGTAAGNRRRRSFVRRLPLLAAAAACSLGAAGAYAADADAGPASEWSWWRLPTHHSTHGDAIDTLYYFIFWLTMATFVAVWAVLAVFLVKYRARPDKRKAVFTHGNTRLEMIWTLVPAVILIILALWTKRSWDAYRYSPTANSGDLARILVVGQQFKWNVVYPGPDGKLGRYLVFPKTTDATWPASDPDDPYVFPTEFQGRSTPGPAYLPEAEARRVLNGFIEKNPLGKDFSDPAGKDDDWKLALGRQVYVPKGRPVEVTLSSKDVIHDFFLPNFRVKLDAVPGMRGLIYFTPTVSSKEIEDKTRKTYTLDQMAKLLAEPKHPDYTLAIDPADKMPEGVKQEDTPSGRRYFRRTLGDPKRVTLTAITRDLKPADPAKPADPYVLVIPAEFKVPAGVKIEDVPGGAGKRYVKEADGKTEPVAQEGPITEDTVKALKAAGFTAVQARKPTDETIAYAGGMTDQKINDLRAAGFTAISAYVPKVWDLVCEELCGQGHYTMKGDLVVLERDEYKKRFETPAAPAAAADAGPPAPAGEPGAASARAGAATP